MPRDEWKKANDGVRGKRERALFFANSHSKGKYPFFVPAGTTVFVWTGSEYEKTVTTRNQRISPMSCGNLPYLKFTLPDGRVALVWKRDTYRGPFVVEPGTFIFELSPAQKGYCCDTRMFFDDVEGVLPPGILAFRTGDDRLILVAKQSVVGR